MTSPLALPNIVGTGEFVNTKQGPVRRPTAEDYRQERELTRMQEALFQEFGRLGTSEQAQGRALSIQRKVADLEMRKHPLLRTLTKHLAAVS